MEMREEKDQLRHGGEERRYQEGRGGGGVGGRGKIIAGGGEGDTVRRERVPLPA